VPRLAAPALCALLALALAAPAAARQVVPGELVVKFRHGADRGEVLAHRRAALGGELGPKGMALVRLQPGDSVAAAAATLERDPAVLYAEPNLVLETLRTPNDPGYGDMWGLPTIQAPAAWDTTTGSPSVVVAVVDTGVAYSHPDLAANIWSNPGEVGGNGLDDDADGKVDDVRGWDTGDDDADPDDDEGHGTHVAGTIGARGDNSTGVVGVSWQASLMPVKVARFDGVLTADAIIEGFQYACSKGAKVVNGSFGGPGDYPPFTDAIKACPGSLFVFAAGNGGTDGIGDDNDVSPVSPCTVDAPNVICVAATGNSGLASFSNYGARTVDIGAPGVGVLSTWAPSIYSFADGTSMAAPHVAGAAALVLAHRPALSALELRNALLNGAAPLPALAGRVATGGMLDVNAALTAATTPPAAPPPPAPAPPADTTAPTDPAVSSTSHVPGRSSVDSTVDITWSGAFDFGSGIDGFSFTWDHAAGTIPDTTKDAEESIGQTTSPPLQPGTYWFHLRTRDNAGNWSAGTHAGPFVIAPAAVPQPKRCVVPRLRGKTRAAAARILKRAGCKLGPVKSQRSRMRKGRIVAQRPPAGRRVGKGTPVVVTVSRGMG
jgi:subtilisin family serine protease